jgi:hypothetical protein
MSCVALPAFSAFHGLSNPLAKREQPVTWKEFSRMWRKTGTTSCRETTSEISSPSRCPQARQMSYYGKALDQKPQCPGISPGYAVGDLDFQIEIAKYEIAKQSSLVCNKRIDVAQPSRLRVPAPSRCRTLSNRITKSSTMRRRYLNSAAQTPQFCGETPQELAAETAALRKLRLN